MSRRTSCQPGHCELEKTELLPGKDELDQLTRPFLEPLLPTGRLLASCGLTCGLARLLGAPPLLSLLLVPLSPLLSLLLVPLVQDSLKAVIGRMQSALTTLFSHLGVSPSTSSSSSSASEYGCAGECLFVMLSVLVSKLKVFDKENKKFVIYTTSTLQGPMIVIC
jgi:hypothetical protein